ncbi:polysaccharide export protein [Myxococcota bacterium]|nr:polysaccharide export protein [Myxococcota bacterium]
MVTMFRTPVVSLLALVATSAGCVSTPTQGSTPIEESQATVQSAAARRFVLGEGDVIEIKVFREPDLGGVYQVTREGLEFPLIGQVQVLGKEAHEVGEEIRARLSDGYLKQPQVTVLIKEHNSRKIHVLGQVAKPGSFIFESGMSVIQAVTNAGGFNPLAATNRVLVTRVVDGNEKKYVVPVGDIGRGNAPNFMLEPGDIVFVPEAIF